MPGSPSGPSRPSRAAARLRDVAQLLAQAASDFTADKGPRLGAALAYYSLFSIGPLLVIAVAIAGFVFGPEAARGEVSRQLAGLVGDAQAEVVEDLVVSASDPTAGGIGTLIGVVTLLFIAGGVFRELKEALDTVWKVQAPPAPTFFARATEILRHYLLSFLMVIAAGLLLLAGLVLGTTVSAVSGRLGDWIPGGGLGLHATFFVASVAVLALVFALLFKFIPDTRVAWADVALGATFTAVLFTLGNTLLGLYLARGAFVSVYGAAASLLAILLWTYYSAQILLFGAEFTHVYAKRFGSLAALGKE